MIQSIVLLMGYLIIYFSIKLFYSRIRGKSLGLDVHEYAFFEEYKNFISYKHDIPLYNIDEQKIYKSFLELMEEV